PWFWSRIHLRSSRLGYLRGGFYRLYARLAELLREKGVRIELGAEVQSISADGGKVVVTTKSGDETFDRLLVTTPTRLFMRLAQGLPDAYRAEFDRGDFYGAHSVILVLNRSLL